MIKIINEAVALNDLNLKRLTKYCSDKLDPISYAKEIKSIHINVGRRSGKTTAIMLLARKDDLIVVHDVNTKRSLQKNYPNCLATINSIYDVVLGSYGLSGLVHPRSFDRVWIDEPHICERSGYGIDLVYENTRANLYIKLGE